MRGQPTAIQAAVLGLLLLTIGLIGVTVVWQLFRAWRRREMYRTARPARRLVADLWSAAGLRLSARLNRQGSDGNRAPEQGGSDDQGSS